jgi:acyl-CoA thioesterase
MTIDRKAQPFLPLRTNVDGVFSIVIDEQLCVGPTGNAFMFGGVGLGAAIRAAEQATQRELVWASAQFLSYARPEDRLDLAVELLNSGRNVSQMRIHGSVADQPVLTVNAALGARDGLPEDQWAHPSEMPPPDQCEQQPLWPAQDRRARFMDCLDVRLAPATGRRAERSPDGRRSMWIRLKDDSPVDAAVLAAFADFVPSGLAAAFGRPGGGNSLDNSLRICRIVPTHWVQCELRISAAARGFGHGAIYMFAEDGTLMASGSQSVILRFSSPEGG